MTTILILEDETALRDMLAFSLERAGYAIKKARDAATAKAIMRDALPDLAIVDWMLPGQSGLEFLREIRNDEVFTNLPVVMLTAKAEEDDKVLGLDGGADDYITKPFSKRELLARVKALLRRHKTEDEEVKAGDLEINLVSHQVSLFGEHVHLGPTEYRLLEHFLKNQDRVYSREQLLNRIWRNNPDVDERTVDVHIRRIRKALASKGYDKHIQTIRGAGYRFSLVETV